MSAASSALTMPPPEKGLFWFAASPTATNPSAASARKPRATEHPPMTRRVRLPPGARLREKGVQVFDGRLSRPRGAD